MIRLIPDQMVRESLRQMGESSWWVAKLRDPRLRKNAKPVEMLYVQVGGPSTVTDMIDEMSHAKFERANELDAVTIEIRRMTAKEIAKWERDSDAKDRREEREERKRWGE